MGVYLGWLFRQILKFPKPIDFRKIILSLAFFSQLIKYNTIQYYSQIIMNILDDHHVFGGPKENRNQFLSELSDILSNNIENSIFSIKYDQRTYKVQNCETSVLPKLTWPIYRCLFGLKMNFLLVSAVAHHQCSDQPITDD